MNKDDAELFGQSVAAQVRAEVAAAGGTVASLSRATGLNRETLDRWVKGVRPMSVVTLRQICAALRIEPAVLIARAEERFQVIKPAELDFADYGTFDEYDLAADDRQIAPDEDEHQP